MTGIQSERPDGVRVEWCTTQSDRCARRPREWDMRWKRECRTGAMLEKFCEYAVSGGR